MIFYTNSANLFGDKVISQYYIYKYKNELRLVYSKPHFTRRDCICELEIESINTIKNSSKGNVVIPGFISVGDKLEGTCSEGYNFRFENILQFEKRKGGCFDGKNKKIY